MSAPRATGRLERMLDLAFSALAALGYGLSDFTGGLASRQISPGSGLRYSEAAALLVTLAALPLAPGALSLQAVICAAIAGICGFFGIQIMYRLMSTDPLSVVSPITAVLAGVGPIVFGLLAGEHLSTAASIGVGAGFLAVALVSGSNPTKDGRPRLSTVTMALGAGSGFGAFFVLISQAQSAAHGGLSPLLVARLAALGLACAAARHSPRISRPNRAALVLMAAAGSTDALADVCYILSVRAGHLSISGTVICLYPAITVLLALVVLREKLGKRATLGLLCSAASMVLIAA